MKYFHPLTEQLIFISGRSNPEFWDSRWVIDNTIKEKALRTKSTQVTQITQRYLNVTDGPILEGGCGAGGAVFSLGNNGYRVIGMDYAQNTLRLLKHYLPKLEIIVGDVRALPFRINLFSGYWSLGVIEHFPAGYEIVAKEMGRVLKPGGFLFLTFPYMSPLRRLKSKLKMYRAWTAKLPEDFNQFALRADSVISTFTNEGFRLVAHAAHDGVTGAKEEICILRPFLERLLNYKGHNRFLKGFETIFSKIVSPACGHCMLLILKKISM
jgi:SAM-dependent methyltransferase